MPTRGPDKQQRKRRKKTKDEKDEFQARKAQRKRQLELQSRTNFLARMFPQSVPPPPMPPLQPRGGGTEDDSDDEYETETERDDTDDVERVDDDVVTTIDDCGAVLFGERMEREVDDVIADWSEEDSDDIDDVPSDYENYDQVNDKRGVMGRYIEAIHNRLQHELSSKAPNGLEEK